MYMKSHSRTKKPRRGRPKVGKGSRPVMTTIEAGLLQRTDRYAKAQGLSRSQVIARGLESILPASNS